MFDTFALGFLGGGFVFALVVSLLVLIAAFEIWMFVEVIRNPNLAAGSKTLWLVGMLLLHPFVAIVYYFVVFKKNTPPLSPA